MPRQWAVEWFDAIGCESRRTLCTVPLVPDPAPCGSPVEDPDSDSLSPGSSAAIVQPSTSLPLQQADLGQRCSIRPGHDHRGGGAQPTDANH